MSYQAVRVLLEDTIKSIDDSVMFAHARASDFNSIGSGNEKRVHLDPMKPLTEPGTAEKNSTKTFSIKMIFYKLDSLQGAEEETTKIQEEMDVLSDKFIHKLNLFTLNYESEEVSSDTTEIVNMQPKEPIIKVTASCMTGFILSFGLVVPDTFDYCSLYD